LLCCFVSETKSDVPIEISCSSGLVNASWLNYEDKESGIAKTEWCIESIDNMCNIQPWETVPTNLQTKSAVIHSLSSVASIQAVVRISNGVGNTVLLKSTKCNPVKTFPPKLDVAEVKNLNDALTDVDYQADTEAIIVTWSSPSNVPSYFSVQAALTEQKENLNVTDSLLQKWRGEPFSFQFIDIPRGKAHIRFSGDRIKPYTKYRPVVRRCNKVGLCRDSVGDGVVIVPDAPPDIQVIIITTIIIISIITSPPSLSCYIVTIFQLYILLHHVIVPGNVFTVSHTLSAKHHPSFANNKQLLDEAEQ
jgi:hypothetical protein